VESEQRVVISAQVLRESLAGAGVIEHPADADSVDLRRFDTESDDPTREEIHDDQHPETLQSDGLALDRRSTGCRWRLRSQ
jgi:hypothetical protein